MTHELKTVALQQCLAANKFDALITGIRRDEDSTRAKERYFSPRNAEFEWDYKDQPPEFWNQFTTDVRPRRARPRAAAARLDRDRHLAVHPAREDSDSGDVFRPQRPALPLPRLLADHQAGRSNAATIADIIEELKITRVSERAGRAQDHHERNAMQKLRAKGFM